MPQGARSVSCAPRLCGTTEGRQEWIGPAALCDRRDLIEAWYGPTRYTGVNAAARPLPRHAGCLRRLWRFGSITFGAAGRPVGGVERADRHLDERDRRAAHVDGHAGRQYGFWASAAGETGSGHRDPGHPHRDDRWQSSEPELLGGRW